MRAEELVLELAATAERRLRPAQADSLRALALLMHEGNQTAITAANDLWRKELRDVQGLGQLLGDSWQSEDALHAALCLRACQAITLWFSERSPGGNTTFRPGKQKITTDSTS